VNCVRTASDFIITGKAKEILEHTVKPEVQQFMQERGLVLSPEQTRITHVEDGFDFLGQNVRKYKGKLLIKPAQKNAFTFLENIRKRVKDDKQAAAGYLIAQLNPKIRGWANYHRHIVSKETFRKMDHAIFMMLWPWAKRRHPKKSHKWIRKNYFHCIEGDNWVFSGEVLGRDGVLHPIRLLKMRSSTIERHAKIQSQANSYDPQWEMYFEKRLDVKTVHNLRGKRKLLTLWKQQNGLCPLCSQKITKLTGWHSHHIVWRSLGGGNELENQVLLQPEGHDKLHHQGLTVSKPRPARGVRKA
jgi:RNA-directed DNA polymerase